MEHSDSCEKQVDRFFCQKCNFGCHSESTFNRHLSTRKHQIREDFCELYDEMSKGNYLTDEQLRKFYSLKTHQDMYKLMTHYNNMFKNVSISNTLFISCYKLLMKEKEEAKKYALEKGKERVSIIAEAIEQFTETMQQIV